MLLLTLSCFLFVVIVDGQTAIRKEYNQFCVPKYKRIGCQVEELDRTMIQDDRNSPNSVWGKHVWDDYAKYLDQLLCVCQVKAKYKKFKYFTISFYGQCAGVSQFGDKQVDKNGCINGEYHDCNDTDRDCAGKAFRDAIYLTEIPEGAADLAGEVETYIPRKRNMAAEYKSWKKNEYLAPQQRPYESYFPKGEKGEDDLYYARREAETDDERRLKFFRRLYGSQAKRVSKLRVKQEDEPRNSFGRLYLSPQEKTQDEARLNFFRRLYGSHPAK